MKRAAHIERRNRIILAYAIALGADFADPPAASLGCPCRVRRAAGCDGERGLCCRAVVVATEQAQGREIRARAEGQSWPAAAKGGAMTDVLLMIIIVGVFVLAVGVDLGFVVGWARRRWR